LDVTIFDRIARLVVTMTQRGGTKTSGKGGKEGWGREEKKGKLITHFICHGKNKSSSRVKLKSQKEKGMLDGERRVRGTSRELIRLGDFTGKRARAEVKKRERFQVGVTILGIR